MIIIFVVHKIILLPRLMFLVLAAFGILLRFAAAPPHRAAPLARMRHTRPIEVIVVVVFLVALLAH